MSSQTKALVLDVDGVVSPVFGHTAWGDDIVAGQLFGPVFVSPTMCQRLDQLAAHPGITVAWLTSWSASARRRMQPFPGRNWPQVADPTASVSHKRDAWWKWTALHRWLDSHRDITHLAWIDDHLAAAYQGLHGPHARDASALATYQRQLADRSVTALLIAPDTAVGLTPAHLMKTEIFLATGRPGS